MNTLIIVIILSVLLNPIFILIRQNYTNRIKDINKKLINIDTTQDAVDTNKNTISFGYEYNTNKLVQISDKELNQHALVIGTTGSGKTTTLLNIVEHGCKNELPVIYIDGKGSLKLAEKISKICMRHNRTLKVFSLDPNHLVPNLSHYNPFASGNFTEWKNKITTLTQQSDNKGQEHYSLQEEGYISILCEVLQQSYAKFNTHIDLKEIIGYIKDRKKLEGLAPKIDPHLGMRLIMIHRALKDVEQFDLVKILESFYHSHYGHLFETSNIPQNQVIELEKSIKNKEVILFLLDAASYKKDTNMIGRLIINDINSVFASFGRNNTHHDGYCIFDEFASYASPNMASVLSMQRDNGLHAIVGTQSIHAISIENQSVKRVAVELIANCNTFFIHKINDSQDVDILVKTIGTKTHPEIITTHNTKYGNTSYSVKNIDKPLIIPQDIRTLEPGVGYVCQTTQNIKPRKVRFNLID